MKAVHAAHAAQLREVSELLQRYFDGLYQGDVALLREVFHPRALYVAAAEAPPLVRTLDEYLPIVAQRASPASRGDARADRIVSVEFAGPTTAMARVECEILPRRFTDLLSLVQAEGRWQVIAKVFHHEVAPA